MVKEAGKKKIFGFNVEFEPVTSATPEHHSNQLSYKATTGRAGYFEWVSQSHSEVYNDY